VRSVGSSREGSVRAEQLPHATRPLTERHRILIRILAERAVADYLREVETPDGSDPGDASRRKEATA
jgi:hypothetical protein